VGGESLSLFDHRRGTQIGGRKQGGLKVKKIGESPGGGGRWRKREVFGRGVGNSILSVERGRDRSGNQNIDKIERRYAL